LISILCNIYGKTGILFDYVSQLVCLEVGFRQESATLE
jgi:hypothetical protein